MDPNDEEKGDQDVEMGGVGQNPAVPAGRPPDDGGGVLEAKKRLTATFRVRNPNARFLERFSLAHRARCQALGRLLVSREFLVSLVCDEFLDLPKCDQKSGDVPRLSNENCWFPYDAPLDCTVIFFSADVASEKALAELHKHAVQAGSRNGCEVTPSEEVPPVRWTKVAVSGLDKAVESEDMETWAKHLSALTGSRQVSVVYSENYCSRGRATVPLPRNMVPYLHTIPGKTPSTVYQSVQRSSEREHWCLRCLAVPSDLCKSRSCVVRCNRCLSPDHDKSSCDKESGSCLYCASKGRTQEECSTHIDLYCRHLRDVFGKITVPLPSDELMRKVPFFKPLPQKVQGSRRNYRDVSPSVSYKSVAARAEQPVAPPPPPPPAVSQELERMKIETERIRQETERLRQEAVVENQKLRRELQEHYKATEARMQNLEEMVLQTRELLSELVARTAMAPVNAAAASRSRSPSTVVAASASPSASASQRGRSRQISSLADLMLGFSPRKKKDESQVQRSRSPVRSPDLNSFSDFDSEVIPSPDDD